MVKADSSRGREITLRKKGNKPIVFLRSLRINNFLLRILSAIQKGIWQRRSFL